MNIQTLQKLKDNPHYKLSPKQKAELEKSKRKPMVEFGGVKRHDNKLPIHPTSPKRKRRTNRKGKKR